VRTLRDEVDRLFDDFLHDFGPLRHGWLGRPFAWEHGKRAAFLPTIDLRENETAYVLVAELPGMKKENLELSLAEETVILKGERKEEKQEKGESWHRRESLRGSFERVIELPGPVEVEKVKAVMKEGVLTLTLPKSAASRRKAVPIRVE